MRQDYIGRRSLWERLWNCVKSNVLLTIAVCAAVVIFIVWLGIASNSTARQTESYKKVNGAAGLDAAITYDCHASCSQKYDFNVYLFDDGGEQQSVVRPDKDGHVHLAMPQGNYIMLIGKQLAKGKLFPQESITLKNGQELDITLDYRGTLL